MTRTKILVTVIGKQFYEEHSDSIEHTTTGTLEKTNDKYVIRYKEAQENEKDALVTLKVSLSGNKVEMVRMNQKASTLVIETNKRNICDYFTPYGNIKLGIHGKEIKTNIRNSKGNIKFLYDIDINGELSSHNSVNVKIKPLENQED